MDTALGARRNPAGPDLILRKPSAAACRPESARRAGGVVVASERMEKCSKCVPQASRWLQQHCNRIFNQFGASGGVVRAAGRGCVLQSTTSHVRIISRTTVLM